jgi:hypothetical protein
MKEERIKEKKIIRQNKIRYEPERSKCLHTLYLTPPIVREVSGLLISRFIIEDCPKPVQSSLHSQPYFTKRFAPAIFFPELLQFVF